MLSSAMQSSTIPILEQVVQFAQARHGVLAGNLANIDTPGYQTRDLSPEMFQARLRTAIENRNEQRVPISGASLRSSDPFAGTGTTGLAAINAGRNSILNEIEPAYQLIATRRLSVSAHQDRSVGATRVTVCATES